MNCLLAIWIWGDFRVKYELFVAIEWDLTIPWNEEL